VRGLISLNTCQTITGIAKNETSPEQKTAGYGGFWLFLRRPKIRNSREIVSRRLLALDTALAFTRLLAA